MKKLLIAFLLLASVVSAQKIYVGNATPTNPRWAQESDFDGSILFCRAYFESNRYELNGSGWWTDYPGGDQNFLVRLSELTEVRVRFDEERIPFFVVLKLDDPLLMKCPLVVFSDAGTMELTGAEVDNLRDYLLKGGFLWADDFWGEIAWEQWQEEMRRVIPNHYWRDLAAEHPIFSMLYLIEPWQMSTLSIWYGDGHPTSERFDSEDVHFRGLYDDNERMIALATHNTDIADGWEEEKPENEAYVEEFSARSYAFGTNVYLYVLTR